MQPLANPVRQEQGLKKKRSCLRGIFRHIVEWPLSEFLGRRRLQSSYEVFNTQPMVIWFSLEKYPSVRNSKEQKKKKSKNKKKEDINSRARSFFSPLRINMENISRTITRKEESGYSTPLGKSNGTFPNPTPKTNVKHYSPPKSPVR